MLEKARVLVVEDRALLAEDLAAKLRSLGYGVTGKASTAQQAWEMIEQEVPDLILMDIELKGDMDGIALAQKINQQYDIPIIYLSDHDDPQTVGRATATLPEHFLSKPVQEVSLRNNIEIALAKKAAQKKLAVDDVTKDYMFIHSNAESERINFDEILYLEADRSYCTIHTTRENPKTFTKSKSLAATLRTLPDPPFMRVHNSYAINLNYFNKLHGHTLFVGEANLPIPIGKDYIARVKATM